MEERTCALVFWWRDIEGGNFEFDSLREQFIVLSLHLRKNSQTSNMCDERQQESDPDHRPNVAFLCDEWKSSRGGISTFNRELAINVAKFCSSIVNIYCYVPESKDQDQDREDARKKNVNLVTVKKIPGSKDPMDCLRINPPFKVDVVVGHGRQTGVPAYVLAHNTKCKWVQIVHVNCEDLGKHKKEAEGVKDTIEDNENKHEHELDLCKEADKVICVGSMLREKYESFLPDINIETITPGIFENVSPSEHRSSRPRSDDESSKKKEFKVFVLGRIRKEDLLVKGLDIIARAVALDRRFKLICVGSPAGEQKGFHSWFLENTKITDEQLTIRRYRDQEKLKQMFQEADLVALPSRVEGFGLIALEAISACRPVLVSSQAGISESLRKVVGGCDVIVASSEPQEWAKKITELFSQTSQERHRNALRLRENYQKIYSWRKEAEKVINLVKQLLGRGMWTPLVNH